MQRLVRGAADGRRGLWRPDCSSSCRSPRPLPRRADRRPRTRARNDASGVVADAVADGAGSSRGCCRSSWSSRSITFVAGIATDRFVAATTRQRRTCRTRSRRSGSGAADRQLGRSSSSPSRSSSGAVVGSGSAGSHLRGHDRHDRAGRRRSGPSSGSSRSEAVPIPMDMTGERPSNGDLYFDQKFVAAGRHPRRLRVFGGTDPYDENGNPKYPMVDDRRARASATGSSRRARRPRWPAARSWRCVLAGFVVSRRRPG